MHTSLGLRAERELTEYAYAMKKTRRAVALLADSLAKHRQMPPDEAKICEIRAESNRSIAAGDVEGLAVGLAEDFVVVVGDGTLLTRKQYLEAFQAGFQAAEPVRYERMVDSVELSITAPVAAERGHWIGSVEGGRVFGSGTYMAMWRKTGAEWKLRSELFVLLA